jgi:molecular chaperone GrpE
MAYEDVVDEISKGILKGAKEAEAEKKQAQQKPKEQQAAPEEKEDMKEKFLRLAAEFDNYKKRTRKEVEEAGMLGKAGLVKDILPVVDEFQLAMLAMGKEQDKELLKGITMLYSNFMDTLKRNGLSEISCEGRADPFRHEVVMVMESKEKEGTILQVVKKGYEFNGRLIRPASVIVAKQQEQKKDEKK